MDKKLVAVTLLSLCAMSLLALLPLQQAHGWSSTFLSSSQDGYAYSTNADYLTAWNAPTGTVDTTSNHYIGGQRLASTYTIYRAFLYFDTSSIPADATINSATLSVYVSSDYSVTDFTLTIQSGAPTYPHDPLQAEDYNRVHYTGNGGGRSTSTVSGVGYWNITLNSEGLTFINRGGITKLALRSSRDIAGTAPTTLEYLLLASRDAGEALATKLYVTYTYGGNIYLVHGPYYEDGTVADALVNVTIVQPYESSYHTFLNGTDGVADTLNMSFLNVPSYIIWNITTTGNYTRVYYFLGASFDEVWIFIPNPVKPWFPYQFNIADFYGMENPYLETTINVNGQTRIVERKSLSTVGSLTFIMAQWQRYGLRFRCTQGTYTQYFDAETSFSTNLQVLSGAFPSTQYSVPTGHATRLNTTSIQITYADPSLSTSWIYYKITHGSTTDTSDNLTTNSYSATWTGAASTTDYAVTIQANIATQLYEWVIQTPAPISTTNPFDGLFESLGTWPGGFQPMYIPAAIIIVAVLGIFSYFSAGVGCVLAWIVTGVLILMGLYVMAVPAFGFAGFFSIFVAIAEGKKTEKEV